MFSSNSEKENDEQEVQVGKQRSVCKRKSLVCSSNSEKENERQKMPARKKTLSTLKGPTKSNTESKRSSAKVTSFRDERNKRVYECTDCGAVFRSNGSAWSHVNELHLKIKLRCSAESCTYWQYNPDCLKAHEKTHKNKGKENAVQKKRNRNVKAKIQMQRNVMLVENEIEGERKGGDEEEEVIDISSTPLTTTTSEATSLIETASSSEKYQTVCCFSVFSCRGICVLFSYVICLLKSFRAGKEQTFEKLLRESHDETAAVGDNRCSYFSDGDCPFEHAADHDNSRSHSSDRNSLFERNKSNGLLPFRFTLSWRLCLLLDVKSAL